MQCEEKVYSIRREDNVCGVRRKSGVSRMSHLQYEETNCAVLGGSQLQYEEKAILPVLTISRVYIDSMIHVAKKLLYWVTQTVMIYQWRIRTQSPRTYVPFVGNTKSNN